MADQTEKIEMSPQEKRELAKAARKLLGLTLVDLGKLSGLSQPMLSQFETGERVLSDESWTRLLDVLEKLLIENGARLNAEQARLEKELEILKTRDRGKEALASAIEGSIGGPFGEWVGDMLAPTRPGAFERYKASYEDFQRRFGTEGRAAIRELAAARETVKRQRELIARLQDELTKSQIENASLKDWLDAEMVAAMAQDKALELRARVHNEEVRQSLGPDESSEQPLSVRLFEAVFSGRAITPEEHEQARASGKVVRALKGKIKSK